MTVIRERNHVCQVTRSYPLDGVIAECDECGRWWRAVEMGNPLYSHWKRAWVRKFFSRFRRT